MYGIRAGPIRNKKIIANSDILYAFPDKDSKGTIGCIKLAENKGIKAVITVV